MRDVSVVIVNYNTCDLTRDCLSSLYEKTQGLDFDVWVVDNASIDNSCEMIKAEFPQVKLIESKENLGFGRGNNLAIEKCDAKYIFCLNTDTLLINNAINILFDFMEKNPKAGACGGNLYKDFEGTHNTTFGQTETFKELVFRTTKLDKILNQVKKKEDWSNTNEEKKRVDFICGADLMLRKEVLDKVGLFDPDFFFFYEEEELQCRVRDEGYEVWVCPDAKIIHLTGQSVSKNKNYRKMLSFKGQYTFYKKRYGFNRFSFESLFFTTKLILRFFKHPKDVISIWKHIWS